MAILEFPLRLWALGRRVEDLLALQTRTREALESMDNRLSTLEARMTHLEANQGQLVVEARSAASAAATMVAGAVLSDMVTRVTRIEMRAEEAGRRIARPEDL